MKTKLVIFGITGDLAQHRLIPALATPTLFSARDGSRRTIMAMVEIVRGATKVTLNWGRDT